MIIKYQILKEKKLLIQKYMVDFSVDLYTKYMYDLMKQPEWEYVEKVLTDVREIDSRNALGNLEFLSRFRSEIIKKKYLNVFLVDKPLATAITHLYQKDLKKQEYTYAYFSEFESAAHTLELTDCIDDIREVLNNLENELAE